MLGGVIAQIQPQPVDPCFANPGNTSWQFTQNTIGVQCPSNVLVGIGTLTPRAKLDVIGSAHVTKLALNVNPNAMTGYFHLKSPFASTSNAPLFLIENTQRKIVQINNDGMILSREIKVNLQAWPDFVFKPSYDLMPLNRLEEYIKINHHLPNVPSEEVVLQEGVNLGEMNALLLQKIEELTLYIIDQDKRIRELEINQNK